MVGFIPGQRRLLPSVIRTKGNGFFKSFLAVIFLMIVSATQAQFLSDVPYKGIEVSFGTRSFNIESNVPELNGLSVLEEGGQLGLIAGTDAVRVRVGLAGFFYSSNKVGRTIDLFESDLSLNFYPTEVDGSNSIIQPYLTGGLVYDRTKFYGRFLKEDQGPVNYSAGKEPYFGRMQQVRAAVGAGVEISVHSGDFHFVHIYAEYKYAGISVHDSSDEVLTQTKQLSPMMISLGVRFGGRKLKMN